MLDKRLIRYLPGEKCEQIHDLYILAKMARSYVTGRKQGVARYLEEMGTLIPRLALLEVRGAGNGMLEGYYAGLANSRRYAERQEEV